MIGIGGGVILYSKVIHTETTFCFSACVRPYSNSIGFRVVAMRLQQGNESFVGQDSSLLEAVYSFVDLNVHKFINIHYNGEDKKSLTQRALWWKTYNIYVLQEIRQVRSSKNFSLKKSCIEGMCTFYALIFICFYIFDTTNICLVILTGSAEVSATSRLKRFQDTSDRDNQEDLIDWNQMLAKLLRIVGKDEFIDLRLNEDTDLFRVRMRYRAEID